MEEIWWNCEDDVRGRVGGTVKTVCVCVCLCVCVCVCVCVDLVEL